MLCHPAACRYAHSWGAGAVLIDWNKNCSDRKALIGLCSTCHVSQLNRWLYDHLVWVRERLVVWSDINAKSRKSRIRASDEPLFVVFCLDSLTQTDLQKPSWVTVTVWRFNPWVNCGGLFLTFTGTIVFQYELSAKCDFAWNGPDMFPTQWNCPKSLSVFEAVISVLLRVILGILRHSGGMTPSLLKRSFKVLQKMLLEFYISLRLFLFQAIMSFSFLSSFHRSPHHVKPRPTMRWWVRQVHVPMCVCRMRVSVCPNEPVKETLKDLVDLCNPHHNAASLPVIVAGPRSGELFEVVAGGRRSEAITTRASSFFSKGKSSQCSSNTHTTLWAPFPARGDRKLTMTKMLCGSFFVKVISGQNLADCEAETIGIRGSFHGNKDEFVIDIHVYSPVSFFTATVTFLACYGFLYINGKATSHKNAMTFTL